MKNSKIITYSDVHGKNGHKDCPTDCFGIFQNGSFLEYRHVANMPFAVSPDRSVFQKTNWEKQDLKQEQMLHKLSGNYNPRPANYITITQ